MAEIIEITDLAAPGLEVYARLTENQLVNREHPEQGLFIAESPRVIARALDAGCEPVSLLLEKKHLDMIVANNLKVAGAGFGVDTNVVTILTDREVLELPLMGKDQVAARLLDEIRKTYDLSILMTTHDFSMLERYADRVVLLREKILCKGTPLEVLNSDEFAQAFHLGGAK